MCCFWSVLFLYYVLAAQICVKNIMTGCTAAGSSPVTASGPPWRWRRWWPDMWPTPSDAPQRGRVAACSSSHLRRWSSLISAPDGRADFLVSQLHLSLHAQTDLAIADCDSFRCLFLAHKIVHWSHERSFNVSCVILEQSFCYRSS